MQAGLLLQTGQPTAAEGIFNALLMQNPGDAGSAFALARLLTEQGRTSAAAVVIRACLAAPRNARDSELAIAAIELLCDAGRLRDAAIIVEEAIEAAPNDPRLHAYGGMIAIQLGEFAQARARYLFALEHDPRAFEWHVPIGLANTLRYPDKSHPDFVLFRDGLSRSDLSDLARAELYFSLGKANDDIGDYAQAVRHFRTGNAIRERQTSWSRKAWRRTVEAQLAGKPLASSPKPIEGFTPIFIVGMPRSGTTLLAKLLARYSSVCNRGESPMLAQSAAKIALSGIATQDSLERAAARYMRHVRQDDANDARWFIDKQPLNLRYADLALAMFPDAKIICCQRNPRDTALSIWMQCFLEDVQGYAYDFDDIAVVMRDCMGLMTRWAALFPDSIRSIRYEAMVAAPHATIPELAEWIGLPVAPVDFASDDPLAPAASISTASLWQARQPVHSRSVGRWKHYAAFLPELSRFPDS